MEDALRAALKVLQGEKQELEIELEEEKSYSASLADEVEVRRTLICPQPDCFISFSIFFKCRAWLYISNNYSL